jgi:hypothetical protein
MDTLAQAAADLEKGRLEGDFIGALRRLKEGIGFAAAFTNTQFVNDTDVSYHTYLRLQCKSEEPRAKDGLPATLEMCVEERLVLTRRQLWWAWHAGGGQKDKGLFHTVMTNSDIDEDEKLLWEARFFFGYVGKKAGRAERAAAEYEGFVKRTRARLAKVGRLMRELERNIAAYYEENGDEDGEYSDKDGEDTVPSFKVCRSSKGPTKLVPTSDASEFPGSPKKVLVFLREKLAIFREQLNKFLDPDKAAVLWEAAQACI